MGIQDRILRSYLTEVDRNTTCREIFSLPHRKSYHFLYLLRMLCKEKCFIITSTLWFFNLLFIVWVENYTCHRRIKRFWTNVRGMLDRVLNLPNFKVTNLSDLETRAKTNKVFWFQILGPLRQDALILQLFTIRTKILIFLKLFSKTELMWHFIGN